MSNQISSKSDEEKSNLSLHGPVVFAESGFNTFYDLVYGEQYAQYGSIGLSVYMACRSFIINEFKGSLGIRYSIDPRGKSPYNNLIVIQNTSDNSSNKISDVVIEYSDPGNDITYFDDDAGGGIRISNASTGVMPWAPGTWYASVIRRWYKPGEKVTHVGFFMYDYQKDTWFHYLTVTFPCVDILFPGDDVHSMKPTGFLERNNSPAAHYSGSFGQYFAWRSGPGWYKSNTVSVTPGDCGNLWSAETAFQQTAITMSTEVPPFSNTSSTFSAPLKISSTKPKPAGPCGMLEFSVSYNKDGNISAIWKIDSQKPPQLSYSITIYENTTASKPLWMNSDAAPEKRQCSFVIDPALAKGTYLAQIDVTSIFGETSGIVTPFMVT